MLNDHTLDQLRGLRLDGMVHALEDQATSTAAAALAFDDRLTLLVQREVAWRDDRRVARRPRSLKYAAKLNGINPQRYLRHVLERIAEHPSNRIDELLPWAVAATWGDDVEVKGLPLAA